MLMRIVVYLQKKKKNRIVKSRLTKVYRKYFLILKKR